MNTRVVLCILDAMPYRHVGPVLTPVLAELGSSGWLGEGRAVMPSSTYPNHASFVTGLRPARHGIVGNWVPAGDTVLPAEQLGPGGRTIFDAAAEAGVESVFVAGDQHLVGVMGATAAHSHWPPGGVLPDDAELEDYGYASDAEVVRQLGSALRAEADLVVVHLNEPDTAGHRLGPDSAEAHERYSATDAKVAELVELLRDRWDSTVLIVVSDHDQEMHEFGSPVVDLFAEVERRGLGLKVVSEGGSAVVLGDDPLAGTWIDELDVGGHELVRDGVRLVWPAPGRLLALPGGISFPIPGQHGMATTATQVALVAGGHRAVAQLVEALRDRTPEAIDWAPTIAALLGLSLPDVDGVSLLSN